MLLQQTSNIILQFNFIISCHIKYFYQLLSAEEIMLLIFLLSQIIIGWNLVEVELVKLQYPIEKGSYLIVTGGSDLAINAQMKTMNTENKINKICCTNIFDKENIRNKLCHL
jgi:hypothetical protein